MVFWVRCVAAVKPGDEPPRPLQALLVGSGLLVPPLRLLGTATALSFAAMDFWYAGIRRRIAPTYLINGTIQLGFGLTWLISEGRERLQKKQRPPEAAFA